MDYTKSRLRDPELRRLAGCPVCGFYSDDDDVFNRHGCTKGDPQWRLSKERAEVIAERIRNVEWPEANP